MEVEHIVNELIRNYDRVVGSCGVAIHIDDFKKIAIARELKKKGYALAWWAFNNDTDHYEVEIDKIKELEDEETTTDRPTFNRLPLPRGAKQTTYAYSYRYGDDRGAAYYCC